MPLENPKDLLNDITSKHMMQIKQLLEVVWAWKNIIMNFLRKHGQLTLLYHDPIHCSNIAHFNKVQAATLIRQTQHLQGNTSPLG
jgi:hypothetical protein